MRYYILLVALLCMSYIPYAQSFEGSKIGNGIRFVPKDSSFSIQWNTRFQTEYVGVQDLESNDYSDAFTIRRFRIKFKGFLVDPRFGYKIELALANRDQGDFFAENNGAANIVLDAVIKWRFLPNWQLWIGQTKLPGNRERVISSGTLQMVDRSRLNSRYNIDRDQGLQLRHEHKIGQVVLREIGSISSGEGRNVTISNKSGYDYTTRFEFLPFGKFTANGDYFGEDLMREKTPKLSLAASYDYNVGTNRERGQLGYFIFDNNGDPQHSTLATLFADAFFKYNGISLAYEYANKRVANGELSGIGTDGSTIYFYTGHAHNVQGGYLFKNNWSIDARYTVNKPDKYVDEAENRYEIGFSKYIAGHTVKLQANVVYRDRLTSHDQMLYFAQLELGF
ncbi:OprO/OprP family phosphate-selective porin [Reichenbachiella agarivorans]|uniref:OprO/OprP family phosphate-selective porin n=1 Tax=Reichenbachiella agarivorans TaxID=2979464 RepID=A0ABY6CK81_9BACT|nr:OprO/OprP family phosphate-selective porin [Reichenbachiella agarivorans]UXP30931.1 OprO/OprP family phosphate-selective porin [Reichenbachiella agarivorans]